VEAEVVNTPYSEMLWQEIETAANGNYINVTVVDKGFGFIDDALDQSEAE
jgi:hypothetical protein